ncbi:hypothetical protein PPERSA_07401 [Pseudocohnilembus persalinus]|uniref:Uncharacterized protein n=1 Tax=Pseudocohnilembus persalinus TaxID=266149 RepID=A0A0V0QAA9_PSEPJ|nr:hypothetical protein PPERSA_07401 [Pseudocohnilembus persalinus]|eukprot:KRW99158.1 hypothetical protein PPERSA_07401 [Pseudocohnilembus persalinus]
MIIFFFQKIFILLKNNKITIHNAGCDPLNIFISSDNKISDQVDNVNEISDQGAKYISEGIKELKNLTHLILDLDDNKISDQGYKYINEGINELKNLTSIFLDLSILKKESYIIIMDNMI